MRNFWKDECGQDMVEYALVVGIIALGAILGMDGVATQIKAMWTKISTTLEPYTA